MHNGDFAHLFLAGEVIQPGWPDRFKLFQTYDHDPRTTAPRVIVYRPIGDVGNEGVRVQYLALSEVTIDYFRTSSGHLPTDENIEMLESGIHITKRLEDAHDDLLVIARELRGDAFIDEQDHCQKYVRQTIRWYFLQAALNEELSLDPEMEMRKRTWLPSAPSE